MYVFPEKYPLEIIESELLLLAETQMQLFWIFCQGYLIPMDVNQLYLKALEQTFTGRRFFLMHNQQRNATEA